MATDTSTLIPNYVDMDFNTLKARFKEQLEKNAMFNNYNYEGGNITVILESLAYLTELNTYYLNNTVFLFKSSSSKYRDP